MLQNNLQERLFFFCKRYQTKVYENHIDNTLKVTIIIEETFNIVRDTMKEKAEYVIDKPILYCIPFSYVRDFYFIGGYLNEEINK